MGSKPSGALHNNTVSMYMRPQPVPMRHMDYRLTSNQSEYHTAVGWRIMTSFWRLPDRLRSAPSRRLDGRITQHGSPHRRHHRRRRDTSGFHQPRRTEQPHWRGDSTATRLRAAIKDDTKAGNSCVGIWMIGRFNTLLRGHLPLCFQTLIHILNVPFNQ